jgi:L-aspartate oxidase
VFGRRSALAALDEPLPPPEREPHAAGVDAAPAPSYEVRAAMWRDAGLERSADGLRRLLDVEHPLARLVAACALAREESRGAHARTDFPLRAAELDGCHTVLDADSAAPRFVEWT